MVLRRSFKASNAKETARKKRTKNDNQTRGAERANAAQKEEKNRALTRTHMIQAKAYPSWSSGEHQSKQGKKERRETEPQHKKSKGKKEKQHTGDASQRRDKGN